MSALSSDPDTQALCARLAPFALEVLERAADHALTLHAEELAPEHFLSTLLADESAGATRLVLFAFADPETLSTEVVAMSPGIMVVGSRRTLPFSVHGVQALEQALDEARGAGEELVEPPHVFRAAWARLSDEQRQALLSAGAREAPSTAGRAGGGGERALLRFFSNEARRALGAASRQAQALRRAAIGPAHVLAGALEVDQALREHSGLRVSLVQAALAGRDADETPPSERPLVPDERLRRLLEALPPGADTLAVLGWFLHEGPAEVRELLRRQKVTPELHGRAGDAFGDP